MEALDAIDPGWCPLGWDIAWQRAFRLTLTHLRAGGTLPVRAGEVIVQSEGLGAWGPRSVPAGTGCYPHNNGS